MNEMLQDMNCYRYLNFLVYFSSLFLIQYSLKWNDCSVSFCNFIYISLSCQCKNDDVFIPILSTYATFSILLTPTVSLPTFPQLFFSTNQYDCTHFSPLGFLKNSNLAASLQIVWSI